MAEPATASDIAQRIKNAFSVTEPDSVQVDTKTIALRAVDIVLSKEHLEKLATLADKRRAGIVTEDIGDNVEKDIVSHMEEIMKKLLLK